MSGYDGFLRDCETSRTVESVVERLATTPSDPNMTLSSSHTWRLAEIYCDDPKVSPSIEFYGSADIGQDGDNNRGGDVFTWNRLDEPSGSDEESPEEDATGEALGDEDSQERRAEWED